MQRARNRHFSLGPWERRHSHTLRCVTPVVSRGLEWARCSPQVGPGPGRVPDTRTPQALILSMPFPSPRAAPAHLCLGTRQRASALPFRPSCGPSFMHTKRFAQSEGAGTVRFVPELVWRMAWAGLGPLSQCRTISACFWAQLQPCSREALGTRAWAGTRSWPLLEPHRSPMCRMGPEDKGVCPGGTRF